MERSMERSNVSKVAPTSGAFCEFSNTNWHSVNTSENCEHMVSLRCLALVCVICPLEKSKTSSLSNFKMIMLFWQRDSLVFEAPIMSGMKLSQFFGHSRFNIYKKKLKCTSGRITISKSNRYLNENHVQFVQISLFFFHLSWF